MNKLMKVLIVDDEQYVIDGYKRHLEKRYNLHSASSGASALEIIKLHGPFAVIVSDIRMPEMDGTEFLMRVKRLSNDSVTMALFGNADMKSVISLINEGKIYTYPTKPTSSDDLIDAIDSGIALYQKQQLETKALDLIHSKKTNDFSDADAFDKSDGPITRQNKALSKELRIAIENKKLAIAYQPQIEIKTGKLLGFEALARWKHADKGFISPGIFIEIAEETGMILKLGQWMLEEVCSQTSSWRKNGMHNVSVAVNVSPIQLKEPDFAKMLLNLLSKYDLPSNAIEVEITESAILSKTSAVKDNLQRLKHNGVCLSIDDFGTGYASLENLKKFSFDKLKIDQTFVMHAVESKIDALIIEFLINMAHAIGLDVVAEGVETQEQASFVENLGCTIGQGNLWSAPLDGVLLRSWLE